MLSNTAMCFATDCLVDSNRSGKGSNLAVADDAFAWMRESSFTGGTAEWGGGAISMGQRGMVHSYGER